MQEIEEIVENNENNIVLKTHGKWCSMLDKDFQGN